MEGNISFLLSNISKYDDPMVLFPYLGWRIWKTRNDLVFQNKKWSIPEVISKAILDQKLWLDANSANENMNGNRITNQEYGVTREEDIPKTMMDAIRKANKLCCFVDASWTSADHKAGFGWMLMSLTNSTRIFFNSPSEKCNGNRSICI